MPEKISAYKLEKNQFTCPKCGMCFESAGVVSGGKPAGMRKGHILICSGCGSVLRLGDNEFKEMHPQEIAKLDPKSQQVITMSKAMVLSNIAAGVRKSNGQK